MNMHSHSKKLMLSVMLIFFAPLSFSQNRSVYYEPKIVELDGVIVTLKFPGPPNYESIKDRDADETRAYLILDHPINLELMPKIQTGNDAPEKNVKLIQLIVLDKNNWKYLKEGNRVHLTGSLSSALTGHHHARILLQIDKIKVSSTQKVTNKKLDLTQEDQEFIDAQNLQN